MKQLNSHLPDYLLFTVLAGLALLFLYFFFIAVKSYTIGRLVILTRVMLLATAVLYLLRYELDLTILLPLRFEALPRGLRQPIIFLIACLFPFLLSFGRLSKAAIGATWIMILVLNGLAFGWNTHYYLTWEPKAQGDGSSSAEIIFGHVSAYSFDRYLLQSLPALCWNVLSVVAIHRVWKARNEKTIAKKWRIWPRKSCCD